MIDIFNIADNNQKTQIFYSSSSGNTHFQTWQKPNGIKMIHFLVIGAGGGGGGGRTGGNNTGTGGGGGGSGGVSIGLFPANLLPDILYISVGCGGLGGTPNTVGSTVGKGDNGGISFVCISASTGSTYVVMQSGDSVAGGGGRGDGSSNTGSAGVGSAIWDYTLDIWPQLGHITANAGQNGGIGGPTGNFGGSVTQSTIVTGGGGGGGESSVSTSYSGGSINGTIYKFTRLTGGTADATGNTIVGSNGYFYNLPSQNASNKSSTLPMFFTGGAGGGAANSSSRNAGGGGAGAYGCGGGGGGASYTGTGGTGGRGGDGLVIITCW